MTQPLVNTYEEAGDIIRHIGILPLSSFIPDHPSLESITPKESWHNGLDSDPWLWRDRYATDGVAAYGRFFKKKPLLVSAELFPLLKVVLGDEREMEERFADGELSVAAKKIHDVIAAQGVLETRQLRKEVGLEAKESKSDYDKGLIELQETADLVIAGIAERLNDNGVKSGWNGTCYDLADRWMDKHGIAQSELTYRDAKKELLARLEAACSEKAFAFFQKLFG